MYCGKCGTELSENAVFCPGCGERVNREPAQDSAQSSYQAPEYQAAPQSDYQAPNYQSAPQSSYQAPGYQSPGYQPPVYQQTPAADGAVSVGDWMLSMLLVCIPIVGIVMLLVWAFGSSANLSKKNWARASLLWVLIGIALSVVFGASVFALLASALS